MHPADPFPRRTATPGRLAPWLLELARTLPGLIDSYLPGRGLDGPTRERLMLAVTEVNGCRYCAWIHGPWQDLLGDSSSTDLTETMETWARACAEAGHPVEPGPLADRLPGGALQAARATVAQIQIANLVGNTVDGLLARVTRKRSLDPVAAAGELILVAAALPIAVPMVAAGAALRFAGRVVPPMPVPTTPASGEANLLAHLLAEALPRLLRHGAARLAVIGAPMEVAVGVQAGRTEATVRVGRGRLAVENGIAPDSLVVLGGDVDALLRLATGDFSHLSDLRLRPS